MTQDQIIEFAQEATRYANDQTDAEGYNWDLIRDERFAQLVAQYEREQCAKVCEAYDDDGGSGEAWALRFAQVIRERGNQ